MYILVGNCFKKVEIIVLLNLGSDMSNLYGPLLLLVVLPVLLPFAFAQHHGGQQAPPISFGDGQVTVSTSLHPVDFSPNENSSVDLRIRFYDAYSDTNIESTTYRVQIFYGEELVANQMFFDKDGNLEIKIQPKSSCDNEIIWKCTKYNGETDPIVPNALVSSSSSKPVITGPVFDKSGEYTVKTSIIGAKNPKTQTTEDIVFETKIIIPQEQKVSVTIDESSYPVMIKTYQTAVTNFVFDSSGSFEFQIPFDWSHLEHTDEIKINFEFPKEFPTYENIDGFTAKMTDNDVSSNIHYDKYSKKDFDIIHFTINKEDLKKINSHQDIMVTVSPDLNSSFVKQEIVFENGYKAMISYDPTTSTNQLLLGISFFDSEGNIVPNVRYGYGLKAPSGKETVNVGTNPSRLGIELPNGMESRYLDVSEKGGKYTLQIGLIGLDSKNFDRLMYEKYDFEFPINDQAQPISKPGIPSWIKNNAGWWADGSIDDVSFITGIQYLIEKNIIQP